MLFRGTAKYASVEIDQLFDAMGAELNAGTGKETTSVYARVLDVHLEEALDVMADMVWRPRFDAEELAQERQIVLEEIAMYEDDPQDKVFDVLGEAVFGDHPLGRAIIGRADVVAGTPAPRLAAFHGAPLRAAQRRRGRRRVDRPRRARRARRARRGGARGALPPPAPSAPPAATVPPRVRFLTKDTEQYHLCLGGPGLARDDERRFALRVLDNVLGGTSSSRLFQEVREKRGLAYSVYSFQALFAGTGEVGLYLGTRPENVVTALDVVAGELERFRADPASEAELSRPARTSRGASCSAWSRRRRG